MTEIKLGCLVLPFIQRILLSYSVPTMINKCCLRLTRSLTLRVLENMGGDDIYMGSVVFFKN